ncbi:retrotransposon protein, putative, Ty3-gypsy subclass [Panicum miliaceum]|uniref:Retrotransposon protein, putative, Ty3-gypsy subclass n=1 Tax=Panicum miliaceum TaxID=4540 RepID=A0A3L6RUW5_PANMI|nr:retrotransposon protein, putative, Ty3-gypsy subclass [Panicum miliaceum]
MVESDEISNRHHNERLEQISEDENTVDAANETPEAREAHRLRNRRRATHRRNTNEWRARIQRDLDAEFAAVQDAGFNTPYANIADLEKLPTGDLRDKINVGRDAHSIIENRRRERARVEGKAARDDSNHFPAFSSRFDNYKYPEGFKPVGITKYDGKQSPHQWVRCYTTAIEVAGGSNTTKVVYFRTALETAPLTLESLMKNSINSLEQLRNVFIDNIQGVIARAGTRHDLTQ